MSSGMAHLILTTSNGFRRTALLPPHSTAPAAHELLPPIPIDPDRTRSNPIARFLYCWQSLSIH